MLGILLLLFLLIVLYVLFVPIILYIDTATNQYFFQLKGLAKATIETDKKEIIIIKLRLLLFHFNFYPLKRKTIKKSKKTVKKKRNIRMTFTTLLRIVRSFKIKQFKIDIDTGDYITNAQLYPIAALLNYSKHAFYINFSGNTNMLLFVKNRPIRVIRSFFNI